MSRPGLEEQLAALETLRTGPASPAPVDQLRRALGGRQNLVVAKAAAVAAHLGCRDLVPDLVAAFDRALAGEAKADPQCWAKNALAKALVALGHYEPEIFLRGSRHVQPEPVWGGRQDTAATLRGTCVLALPACRIGPLEALTRMAELLADPEAPVRRDAARAIAQLGLPEGVPLLRLKALAGDREPEVTGHCLTALVGLQPREALDFVAGFLSYGDPDVRMEAVAALCESHEAPAASHLERYWSRLTDPEAKRTVLALAGASPLPEMGEFLLGVVAEANAAAGAAALEALAAGRFRAVLRDRAAACVRERGEPALRQAFAQVFEE